MAIITQSPRLTIREFLPEEEPLFLELLSDKRLTDYLPKRNTDENRKIFKDTLVEYEQGVKLSRWGIFNNTDDEFVGLALLKSIEGEPQMSELGYVIHHHFKGQGIATEVANALLKYGFEQMQLMEIYAVTDQANIASQRVLIKAGLVPGELLMRNGEWLSYFKISAAQWFWSVPYNQLLPF